MQTSSTPTAQAVAPATETSVEEAIFAVMMSVGRRMRQRRPDDTVDFAVLPVLKTLDHNGPMRVTALAAELGLDASTVSRHAQALEGRGLIERSSDPDDGRASRVAVSSAGSDCLHAIGETRRAELRAVLDHWTARDREQLRVLLLRLNKDLETTNQENV